MKVLLKKYLLIYFSAIVGIAFAITAAFILGDLANKMKPGDQVLFEVPDEEAEQEKHILKLYAWRCYWNEDVTHQEAAVTEMKLGEVMRVGSLKKAFYSGNFIRYDSYYDHPANDIMFLESSVIIAEGDGELEAEYSGGLIGYGKPGNSFSDAVLAEFPDLLPKSRYSLLLNPWAKRKIGYDYTARGNRDGTIEINEKMYNREYKQLLSEVYPNIRGEDGVLYRCIEERSLVISMYDLTDKDRLIAKAEVRIYMYSKWHKNISVIGADTLERLGINIPDSYGYTEAVLYDYWQAEEW